MNKKEALNTLMKMRAWRAWGKEQKEEERPEMPEQKDVDEAFDVCIELLQQPFLPSNLDEVVQKIYPNPEDKQLLLKDLCGRLPYGVMCKLSVKGIDISITEKLELGGLEHFIYGTMDVLPYLRPMSSMTKDEYQEYDEFEFISASHFAHGIEAGELIDWLNEHHFDYRGLIEKGLALEAPEDMYKTE